MNKMKMFFLVIMVSYVMLFITSFSIWWGFFIFFTMVALMKMKFYLTPSYSMLLYYLIQELSGVFFMMGVSMNFQFILIMVKGGFSPFHNWLNLVMKSLKGQVFMWMMTWQKMPYYLILSQLLGWNLVLLLIVGSIIPLVQVLFLMNYKTILFLLMVSSGNNLLVYSYFNFSHFLIILPIYLFMMNNMVGMVSLHGNMYMGVEMIYMLMGMPGSIPFMIKLMMLTGFMESGLFFFLFMMTMVFNLTVSLNILLNMNSKFSMMNKSFMFMIMSLCLVVFL